MFQQFTRRRRNGKVSRLPIVTRDTVDKMLMAGVSYREIVDFLKDNDVELSRQAVCNYAKDFLATTQQLRMAQENYRFLLSEMEQAPDMDTSEAILRVVSNAILNTLANTSLEDWKQVNLASLLREANALVKVSSHKKRVDALNKSDVEKVLNSIKVDAWHAFGDKDPELLQRIYTALDASRQELEKKADAGLYK